MKTKLAKKLAYILVGSFASIFFVAQLGFAQGSNTPYPIIFVHGINSDNTTWGHLDGGFDNIFDYLDGAGLRYGDNINICLNHNLALIGPNSKKEDDVFPFTTNPNPGDYYTVNFRYRADGQYAGDGGATLDLAIAGLSIDNVVAVNVPEIFEVNDIIRVDDEYMQVTNVNAFLGVLTVNRAMFGSPLRGHLPLTAVWNISNESNQGSIAKQGYGLKLAIDEIKHATGATKVILVCHSMGGLAAREYLRSYPRNDVAKLITIGTPHYGADITKAPNWALSLPGVDGNSDAVRDLRASFGLIFTTPAPYLFGGSETSIPDSYTHDVNANGLVTDRIVGLDQNYSSLNNMAHTYIVAYLDKLRVNLLADGVVTGTSQYISPDDTLVTTGRNHLTETKDYYSLLRGLDEPDDPALAYEIAVNATTSTTKGFITYNKGYTPLDVDLFKIVIKSKSFLKVDIGGSQYSGILLVNLLNSDQAVLQTVAGVNQSMTHDLEAGTYYVQVNGAPKLGDHPSYQYPYTLTTTSTIIPPPKFTVTRITPFPITT